MCPDENSEQFDPRKFFPSKEETLKVAKKFHNDMTIFLKKHRKYMITLKGFPGVHGISMKFGPYVGRNLALYISKNPRKPSLKDIDIARFYSEIEGSLVDKVKDKIYWRSNLLKNRDTGENLEVEFVPMAFRGDFLSDVLKKCKTPLWDKFMLVHAATITVGKLFGEAIGSRGFSSSCPGMIAEIEKDTFEKIEKEIEEADFIIDLQFTEKSVFSLTESELISEFSESELERKIGFELIKEAIPILVQYEIKADFPTQKSDVILAKPDFVIVSPLKPAAIFCDSYRYHQRKKDQIFKDRRIDRRLQRLGFVVFRFSEEEIDRNLEGCVEEIKEYYFGKEFSLSTTEVLTRKLARIDAGKISEWERRFVETLFGRIREGKSISLKEERILDQILRNAGLDGS